MMLDVSYAHILLLMCFWGNAGAAAEHDTHVQPEKHDKDDRLDL